MVALRYAAALNGMNELALTKLDVLDDFETLRVCEFYELDGERIDWFPLRSEDLARVKPVYREFGGWKGKTTREASKMEDLPSAARHYIDWLQATLSVPFKIVSTGPKRNETILL